jgi:hypothetical protein
MNQPGDQHPGLDSREQPTERLRLFWCNFVEGEDLISALSYQVRLQSLNKSIAAYIEGSVVATIERLVAGVLLASPQVRAIKSGADQNLFEIRWKFSVFSQQLPLRLYNSSQGDVIRALCFRFKVLDGTRSEIRDRQNEHIAMALEVLNISKQNSYENCLEESLKYE